jgi:hypothetical protein
VISPPIVTDRSYSSDPRGSNVANLELIDGLSLVGTRTTSLAGPAANLPMRALLHTFADDRGIPL